MQNKPEMASLHFSYVILGLEASDRIGRHKRKKEKPAAAGMVHLFPPVPERRTNPDEAEEPHSWYLPYPVSKNGAYILQNNLAVPHRRPPHFFFFESRCASYLTYLEPLRLRTPPHPTNNNDNDKQKEKKYSKSKKEITTKLPSQFFPSILNYYSPLYPLGNREKRKKATQKH